MPDLDMKRHDTAPALQVALKIGGATPDTPLDGTVEFIMQPTTGAENTPVVGVPKVKRAATVVDPDGWVVRHAWQAEDTDTAGVFAGEFEHTRADGTVQTFPADGYISIGIYADLDNAGGTP